MREVLSVELNLTFEQKSCLKGGSFAWREINGGDN